MGIKSRKKLKIWYLRLDIFAREHYTWFWAIAFLISRVIVLATPPPGYSDVTHYYERYANMWQYGLPPYTHVVFEYGPLAALVIWLPLLADIAGVGKYYLDYRILSCIFDGVMFAGLLWYNKDQRQKRTAGLLLHLVLTTMAHRWLYEGIDMIFASLAILAIVAMNWRSKWATLASQLLLWASTAVKFLTLPLIVPFYLIQRRKWTQSLITFALTFAVIWGGPLLYYRSSLSVPFVYNSGRTIKYNTVTHLILRTMNWFQETEAPSKEAPDYSFTGPKSEVAGKVLAILYPMSLLLILFGECLYLYKMENEHIDWNPVKWIQWTLQPGNLTKDEQVQAAIRCYLAYFLVSFFTAKIYSNPFLIWILPVIVIMRWQTDRREKWFWGLISVWTILELTGWLTADTWRLQQYKWFEYEIFEIIYGWCKWVAMTGVLGVTMREMLTAETTNRKTD